MLYTYFYAIVSFNYFQEKSVEAMYTLSPFKETLIVLQDKTRQTIPLHIVCLVLS